MESVVFFLIVSLSEMIFHIGYVKLPEGIEHQHLSHEML